MNQDKTMRVGIIGAGWIAEKAAITLNGLKECECYAIASRSLEKAEAFAQKWNMPKAYGSYAELIADDDVDLIYVATPHSHHYDVTKEALMADKPCLVEKAFMAEGVPGRSHLDALPTCTENGERSHQQRTNRDPTVVNGNLRLFDGRQATHHEG